MTLKTLRHLSSLGELSMIKRAYEEEVFVILTILFFEEPELPVWFSFSN